MLQRDLGDVPNVWTRLDDSRLSKKKKKKKKQNLLRKGKTRRRRLTKWLVQDGRGSGGKREYCLSRSFPAEV